MTNEFLIVCFFVVNPYLLSTIINAYFPMFIVLLFWCFQINLLDSKRSLNVNIFLKQFRMPNEEIVKLLQEGESAKFGAEKLKSLQKILPSQEEVGFKQGLQKGNKKKKQPTLPFNIPLTKCLFHLAAAKSEYYIMLCDLLCESINSIRAFNKSAITMDLLLYLVWLWNFHWQSMHFLSVDSSVLQTTICNIV